MRGWIGIVLGFAGLALVEGIVSSKRASSNVGGFLSKAGDAVRWFTSPAVPFFSTGSSAKQSSQTSANSPNPSTTQTSSTAAAAALSYGG